MEQRTLGVAVGLPEHAHKIPRSEPWLSVAASCVGSCQGRGEPMGREGLGPSWLRLWAEWAAHSVLSALRISVFTALSSSRTEGDNADLSDHQLQGAELAGADRRTAVVSVIGWFW